jgi:hypothetical protein
VWGENIINEREGDMVLTSRPTKYHQQYILFLC